MLDTSCPTVFQVNITKYMYVWRYESFVRIKKSVSLNVIRFLSLVIANIELCYVVETRNFEDFEKKTQAVCRYVR